MQKIRAYNSRILADTYSTVTQFMTAIESLAASANIKDPAQLPPSAVPTDTFFMILACYDAMFNILYSEHLIKDGHIKPSHTIH